MTYRSLRPEELESWFAHCQSVFQEDDPNYFRKHYEMDPYADPSMIFVAMDDDEIAATVRVFLRTVWIRGRAVAMGGIGEVSTKSAYRRQGLAANLLQMAIAAMEERGMPVSILYGDQRIYEGAGWRFRNIVKTETAVEALPYLSGDFVVRPFKEADLSMLMGVYDLFAGRLDGAVVRDEAYWRRWVLPQWRAPQVLLSDGVPVAYLCAAKPKEGLLRVTEMCAAPQGEALLPGFMRKIASDAQCERVLFTAALCAEITGDLETKPDRMMVRLNLPMEGIGDSDMLADAMRNADMFGVDHF